jgi:hypothetical protein
MDRQNIENQLDLKLPDNFENYDASVQESIVTYLSQLDPIERKAYMIGKSHLGSSFNLIKSNGYADWKKKQRSL